jgi:hypothetical protein
VHQFYYQRRRRRADGRQKNNKRGPFLHFSQFAAAGERNLIIVGAKTSISLSLIA